MTAAQIDYFMKGVGDFLGLVALASADGDRDKARKLGENLHSQLPLERLDSIRTMEEVRSVLLVTARLAVEEFS